MSEREKTTRVGVDTGGTFTDIITQDEDGRIRIHKLLSTPDDPSRAIGAGVDAVLGAGERAAEVIHGTTVATNALLERRGAKVAFVTTRGFEELLWLRRQQRPYLYALRIEMEPPLVEEEMSFGVRERLAASGEVLEALEEEEIKRVVDAVAGSGAQAVVICLLHSYANGEHEERLARAFRAHEKDWHVTSSREVTATFREYERGSTAAINGYIGPVMARYLHRLQERLAATEQLEVMQSHGGRTSAEHSARLPVHTVLSGPAGGVVGALAAAKDLGMEKIISFDMGGTSTDVSLANGEPTITEEGSIGQLPLQVPVIDIFTVGAGGGSLAGVDAGGALKVGPRSAGADPGPAAYGRGGSEPTVTDAHVVLGSLVASRFLGGAMTLDREAAKAAVESLAQRLKMSWRETARGILEVADATMARAIKVISLERGYDPRAYTLVSFGGAGGLHACRLATLLEMERVLVPRFPGILSAAGMLRSAPRRLYSQTVLKALSDCLDGEGARSLRSLMGVIEEQAREEMGAGDLAFQWTASLRYQGQSFSIPLEVDWHSESSDFCDPTRDFEAEHERLYGYVDRGRGIELVDLRLQAVRSVEAWPEAATSTEPTAREVLSLPIDLGDGEQEVRVVERCALRDAEVLEGPAIITEYSGTTVVLRSWQARVVRGHLLLERREEEGR